MTGDGGSPAVAPAPVGGALDVFRNRPFLLLWLAQAATQIGGNMVIFGLTVIISKSTGSTTAVSALILTFLLPAVLFSALAGVFVDRLDRRLVLILTNVLRGLAFIGMFFVGTNLVLIYLLNIIVST
ncbi:MAG TPA: MFS transporter, partial [Candidatus Limnocylindrales bacterium]|nr:MFS transporter [Candidatus Limnocylindrales bacterium]